MSRYLRLAVAVSREERADYLPTVNNGWFLMLYRTFSHEPILDWLAKLETVDSSDNLSALFKSASFSEQETSLLTELVGVVDKVDEFRRRMPRYKELEKLLQSDHLEDLGRIESQELYKRNMTLMDEASKDIPAVIRLAGADIPGDLTSGEHYAVVRRLLIYYLRVINDQILLTSVGIVTK